MVVLSNAFCVIIRQFFPRGGGHRLSPLYPASPPSEKFLRETHVFAGAVLFRPSTEVSSAKTCITVGDYNDLAARVKYFQFY